MTMQRTAPPFRADHVGSLLRPAALKEARAKRAQGGITAAQLKEIEDREIENAIRRQEAIGLKLATDGEFRRSWWHFDFFRGLDGVTFYTTDHGIQFKGVQTKAEAIKITGKLGFSGHPMLEHFKFLKSHTRVTPKMTIPAPSTFHFRQGRAAISKDVYPTLDPFFDDLAAAYRAPIRAFYDAGCRYLQLDDTAWAMVCDPNERAQSKARGDDPDTLPQCYAALTNAALAQKPADMTITMHSCRGNFRSTFIASGGYDFVAEQLLGNTAFDGYFLEYDSDRAGGFEPLRFFPKGKKPLVLGLVTSKSGKLESKDAIKRRIDEATKYVALDQLCLSPQCGFASTEEGNVLAEDEQWAKLRMIVEIAEEVWGKGLSSSARGRDPAITSVLDASLSRGVTMKTGRKPMQRTAPPFRADHVGSLLRTAALKEAREKRKNGQLSDQALREIEDREIEAAIRKQEDIGLASITDGDYRRISWNYDFLERLDNVESYIGERKIKFAASGPQPRPILLRVIGRLGGYKPHPMIEHFKFLKAHTRHTPKLTIPSPSSLHFRYGRDVVPETIYPSMDDFYRDLGQSYRKVVRAFADAGCRYLQLDEVNFTYLCDPSLRKVVADRGEDPAALPALYAGMVNAAMSDIPSDMTVTMHLCRGNFRSSFVASGGYEPVAEELFNTINVHGYFMEYDTERAGGFEPLRFVPKNKTVVLGLVTTKSGTLENKDAIKRRIEQAAKYVPLDQLCLSPQCGFASTEEGNTLAEAEQWAKLRMIVEIAEEVWG